MNNHKFRVQNIAKIERTNRKTQFLWLNFIGKRSFLRWFFIGKRTSYQKMYYLCTNKKAETC